jgi:hypothetical protein
MCAISCAVIWKLLTLFRIFVETFKKKRKMKTLKTQIESANSTKELESIVKAMPNQSNGEPTSKQRILENCFWYHDLQSVQQQKNWTEKKRNED